MFSPTSTVLQDQQSTWSIFDAARPVGDLDGITDQERSWAPGIDLWWAGNVAHRWPHRRQFNPPNASYEDPDIAGIADPSVWPTAVSVDDGGDPAQVVYSAPDGEKEIGTEPDTSKFRSFTVYSPMLETDLAAGEAIEDRAVDIFRTQVALQVASEFADSLFTKNEGLYRTATDQSGGNTVDPIVGLSVLSEAFGTGQNGAHDDAIVTVPWHALPNLVARRLVSWSGGRLIDCWGNPVNTTPGHVLNGPLTSPLDLETSVAPTTGTGWFYISPRPYVAVGQPRRAVSGHEQAGRLFGQPAVWAYGNQRVALAEAPAIVVFRPTRVFAVHVVLNEVVGTS